MYRQRKVVAIILGAGSSRRMGFDKMFYLLGGVEVLRLSIARFDTHRYIDEIVVVAGENRPEVEAMLRARPTQKPVKVVSGGAQRADSVAAGIAACGTASLVAIHDGARPFVSADVITRTVDAAAEHGAAAPAIPVKDTIKRVRSGLVTETLPRDELRAVQTPQVFDYAAFSRALAACPGTLRAACTDDCMIMERAGVPVRLVEGEEANLKITTQADLAGVQALHDAAAQSGTGQGDGHTAGAYPGGGPSAQTAPVVLPRMGHGYDVHKLVVGRRLILGGVDIPHTYGLLGHSDADVLLHAVSDAVLGAAALGDIGKHFPDTDPQFAGADSLLLLKHVGELAWHAGWAVHNIDATLLCQQPKLSPHIPAMRRNIAHTLAISENDVSVKATTEEGLGFTGSGQGIAAHCVCMLRPL